MPEHIKGTYLFMCGSFKEYACADLKKRYCGLKENTIIPPANLYLYFNFKRLTDRIKMFNLITDKILDPYNVYHPIVKKDQMDDIDFHDEDFTWIKK